MTQTQPRTISFLPDDVLFQYFTREDLVGSYKMTDDEWDYFLCAFQSRFAMEATEIAKEMMENFLKEF